MTEPKDSIKKPNNRLNTYARFSGIAFQMIAIIVLGTYAGVKLDESYPNEHSLWTIICSFLAVIVAMIYIIRRVGSSKGKTSNE